MKPTQIKYIKHLKILTLTYGAQQHHLEAEFLRIQSPSAEVRGHLREQAVLQHGKKNVEILEIKPIGRYAIQFTFSDGHDSGLYSWEYLHFLSKNVDELWQNYLKALKTAGLTRDPDTEVLTIKPQ